MVSTLDIFLTVVLAQCWYMSLTSAFLYTYCRFLIPIFLVLDDRVARTNGLRDEKKLPNFERSRGLTGRETLSL